MKSEFGNRETLGKQLAKTKVAHVSNDPIETPDLIGEMGKSYMRELMEAVENKDMPDEFYIMAIWEKMPVEKDRTISFIFASRVTVPPMEPDTDVYYVNKLQGRVELLWSLPSYANMKQVLKTPSSFDQQTVYSLKTYKRLEKEAKKIKTA
ncbi:MAG: hypothetical protein ACE5GV_00350 [Candidatus Scalindua sp.]